MPDGLLRLVEDWPNVSVTGSNPVNKRWYSRCGRAASRLLETGVDIGFAACRKVTSESVYGPYAAAHRLPEVVLPGRARLLHQVPQQLQLLPLDFQ